MISLSLSLALSLLIGTKIQMDFLTIKMTYQNFFCLWASWHALFRKHGAIGGASTSPVHKTTPVPPTPEDMPVGPVSPPPPSGLKSYEGGGDMGANHEQR